MTINIRRLQVFVSVAEHRGITNAAHHLCLTPPAVTKSLRELETGLGVKLFSRTSTGMLLTPAGKIFLLHSTRALQEIERGKAELTLLRGGEGGRISLGTTVEASMLVLPKATGLLVEKRPQIDITINGGTYESLLNKVRSGALDLFLGVVPEEGTANDISAEPLFSDELTIVCRPNHPLCDKKSLTLADLSDQRWVLSSHDGPLTHYLKKSFTATQTPFPERAIIVEPLSPLRGLLQHSNLIAAVTRVRLHEELELGQLIALPVKLPETRHVISIVRRSEPYQSKWAKELSSLLHITAEKFKLTEHH